jgi:glycosyltransferase involved in cell wall biosynthesis
MGLNLHIYPSAIRFESRMLKATKSLASTGTFSEIHLIGILEPGLTEHERIDHIRSIWRVPLSKPWPIPKTRGLQRLLQWTAKIFTKYRHDDVSVVHCHSLDDLTIGVLLKIGKRGVKLVYDAHELETERNGLSGIRKLAAKIKERLLIRFVDHTFVVSDSIAAWYQKAYKTSAITVVRNMPSRNGSSRQEQPSTVFRDRFGINGGIVFLYQGALMRGRSIDLMLNAFSKVAQDKHLVLMGYGIYEPQIKQFAQRFGNIHFHEAVEPDKVMRYTMGADVGICLIENVCLSYYYSLPNKLYEYTLAGMPVIVSKFPEMLKFVNEFENGWDTPVQEDSFRNLIENIDRRDIEAKRRTCLKARESIGWDSEEEKLLAVYRALA